MATYARHLTSRKKTPQSEAIPGRQAEQVQNSAGGFVFPVDDFVRLDRFLVLGNEGGSYYASEQKLTLENAGCVTRCLELDPCRTVKRIVEISSGGRAPKNDPAVFALALAASYTNAGNLEVQGLIRSLAYASLPAVCRTGTHLFQFVGTVNSLRGWSRGLRTAVSNWYLRKDPRDLAYQVTKYQQREGWSHRDVLRLAHPVPRVLHGIGMNHVLNWAVRESIGKGDYDFLGGDESTPEPIVAFEKAKRATTVGEVVNLITDHDLVRECIPTQWLKSPEVWEALLERMPLTAMVRNLATMTRVGLLAPLSAATRKVYERLRSPDLLRKARVHPIAVLSALLTYSAGRGARSQETWVPVHQIVNALDDAFYLAFGNVEPTGKRWLLALDVSGSMASGTISGVPGLTPRVASAALALVTAATESQHEFLAFTSGTPTTWSSHGSRSLWGNSNGGVSPLNISPKMRLQEACTAVSSLPFGGTDCALPMLYAAQHKVPVDAFVVLTDSETWAGGIHPTQALKEYRQKMGIPSKLIVCGMVSNGFSIADPQDAGQMDVVGFDTAVPQLMADFVRGS